MKRIVLPLIFSFLVVAVYAQITVTNATFPAVGDTLFTARDNMPDLIDILGPGPNQNWDFSSLQGPNINETYFQPATDGTNFSEYPTAELLNINLAQAENYFNVTNTDFEFIGYAGEDPLMLGVNTIAKFSPDILQRRAPLNYQTTYNSTYGLLVPFAWDDLPATITDSLNLPITPDSIRINIAGTIEAEVDAWGSMTTPNGNYEVLRVRTVDISDTKLEAKLGIFPWQDITNLLNLPFFGLDTALTYTFMNDVAKEPIAVVTMMDNGSGPANAVFKADMVTPTSIHNVDYGTANIIAYPNPAIEDVRFEFSNLKRGRYTLKLYNILGVVVWEQNYNVASNSKTVKVNLSKFKKGTYLYSLVDNKGKTVTTKRLMIVRP